MEKVVKEDTKEKAFEPEIGKCEHCYKVSLSKKKIEPQKEKVEVQRDTEHK